MMLVTVFVLCVSTHVSHGARIVKRDLYHGAKLAAPTSYPASNQPLRYLVHPTAQTPTTSYTIHPGYETIRQYFPPNPIVLGHKFGKVRRSPSEYSPSYTNVHSKFLPNTDFHPDFSIFYRQFQTPNHFLTNDPSRRLESHQQERKRDGYVDGGIPDFDYVTTGGVSGPQPEVDYIRHQALNIPLEVLGVSRADHRLKQGYSPVHYRYNDDYEFATVMCNKYHCPL